MLLSDQKDYDKGEKRPHVEDILGSKAKIRILRILVKHEELNISKIIKFARLNHDIVQNHLKCFTDIGIIQEKNYGRMRIFRYKFENMKARALKNFLEIWEDQFN